MGCAGAGLGMIVASNGGVGGGCSVELFQLDQWSRTATSRPQSTHCLEWNTRGPSWQRITPVSICGVAYAAARPQVRPAN